MVKYFNSYTILILGEKVNRKAIIPLIVIAIILMLVVFAIAGFYFVARRYMLRPVVTEAYWASGWLRQRHVYVAYVDEQVVACVVLAAREATEGDVTLRVRMDIKYWLDKDYATKMFHVRLSKGESVTLEVDFRPSQPSTGRLRGYYMQVDFESWVGKWTMPNSYPPRLTVLKSP